MVDGGKVLDEEKMRWGRPVLIRREKFERNYGDIGTRPRRMLGVKLKARSRSHRVLSEDHAREVRSRAVRDGPIIACRLGMLGFFDG